MLNFLQIRDFAIIDSVELELRTGLTALTGETGAGKSILVDALLLAVGGRATAQSVRHGAERAEITATFDIRGHRAALDWLETQAIDCDGECMLRRVLSNDGRSRAFINGQSVPLQSLREFGELLIDIHGQQEFLSLMRRTAQRELLDAHGRHETLVQAVRQAYERWNELHQRHEELSASGRDREARLELLRYQVRELEAMALKPGEVPELLAEQRRLSSSGRLVEGVRQSLDLLYGDESYSAHAMLSRAQSGLKALLAVDEHLAHPAGLLDEAAISLREAADQLRRYLDRLDIDPQRQEKVERRVATLEELARKHRVPIEDVPRQLERLTIELSTLEAYESELGTMEQQLSAAREAYAGTAAALSKARRDAARDLATIVTSLLQQLGMPGGKFAINVDTPPQAQPGADGIDAIEFSVSANPGQPLLPLARVASGGELSRISLAVQVAAAHTALTPCLVFDEVDSGVGGAVAEIVGRQLHALGERAQVLCVTHLPQVASQAHHHLRVVKLTDGRSTRTVLNELQADERIEELARMLGGVEITAKTREHAREMLESTTKPKRPAGKKKA